MEQNIGDNLPKSAKLGGSVPIIRRHGYADERERRCQKTDEKCEREVQRGERSEEHAEEK